MSCDEHQVMISRLFDGELPPGASSGVFAHLVDCGECRLFYHRLQALNVSLEQIAEPEREPVGRENVSGQARAGSFWRRQVAVRFPVLLILFGIVIAGLFFSLYTGASFHKPETVYITKLPAVIITPESNVTNPLQ
jgi:predicted anti-sigma-YlaC factor YlaD